MPITPDSKSFSRRRFIKGVAAVVAGGVVSEMARETKQVVETQGAPHEIDTQYAVYTPLLENHQIGPLPEGIPDTTTLIFREEASLVGKTMSLPSFEAAFNNRSDLPTKQVFDLYFNDQVELILGDMSSLNILTNIHILATVSLALFPIIKLLINLIELQGMDKGRKTFLLNAEIAARGKLLNLTRRVFLGMGTLTILSVVNECINVLSTSSRSREPVMLALQRVTNRLFAIQSMTDPLNLVVFFRNALIANQLLAVGEERFNRNREKPHITYNVGSAHAGIEDFLLLGKEFTRAIILSYPTPLLKAMVENNIDVRTMISSRVIKYQSGDSIDEWIGDEELITALNERLET